MLVLSRKINEAIKIGSEIEVMVIDVRDNIVRLGISAPQSTQIWRKELWDVIVRENKTAAQTPSFPDYASTPQLPVSTFSNLSKIPTIQIEYSQAKKIFNEVNDHE